MRDCGGIYSEKLQYNYDNGDDSYATECSVGGISCWYDRMWEAWDCAIPPLYVMV